MSLLASAATAGPSALVAVVIDDLGYQPALDRAALELDPRVAVGVIPDAPGARQVALAAAQQGREVLIHLPLSHAGPDDCQVTLCPGLDWSAERMHRHLEWAARQVPLAVGLNNHQGSAFTADAAATRRLVEGLVLLNRQREAPLFVVDSRTTPHSQLAHEAARAGIAVGQRRVFLDHDRSPEAIAGAWMRLLERARTSGQAIAIAHPYPETLAFLARVLPGLDAGDVALVTISELVKSPPGASSASQPPGLALPPARPAHESPTASPQNR
ncbi:MAG: divergent polysaccharide deacetylase family protein [Wenzhouxiangella sp.]